MSSERAVWRRLPLESAGRFVVNRGKRRAREPAPGMIDLSAYRLEPLRKDGELILYRGVHNGPPDCVAPRVLVVALATEYASPATLARLEHECSLAPTRSPMGRSAGGPRPGSGSHALGARRRGRRAACPAIGRADGTRVVPASRDRHRARPCGNTTSWSPSSSAPAFHPCSCSSSRSSSTSS